MPIEGIEGGLVLDFEAELYTAIVNYIALALSDLVCDGRSPFNVGEVLKVERPAVEEGRVLIEGKEPF